MTGLFQDLRYAMRQLRKNPGFTVVAVATLALGIGANTAIYSVVRAVLFKSLPYSDPDRLMILDEYQEHAGRMSVGWMNFLDWRTQAHSFEAMAAYRLDDRTLTGIGEPALLRAGEVSAAFFSILGAQPVLGRVFTESEDKVGASPRAVLSYEFWRNRLGGDSSVLGRELTLSGVPCTVVGVLPPSFKYFPQQVDLYVPIGLEGATPAWIDRVNHPGLLVLARLKAVSRSAAQAEMETIMGRLEQQYPASNSGERASVTPLSEQRLADLRPIFYILLAAVICVLLIACANVAHLELTRAAARQKEFAVRAALGAGKARVMRQLLTESVLLASLGGGLGLLLALCIIAPLLRLAPHDIPRLGETRIDGGVMLFTFVISVLTGILFGTAPAFQSQRINPNGVLKESGATVTSGRPRQILRAGLFVSEVALAMLLVVACGLLIRSLLKAQAVNPGFNPDHVLALDVLLPAQQYRTDEQRTRFFAQALDRIRLLPGVTSTSAVLCPPIGGTCWSSVYLVSDRPVPPQAEIPSSVFNVATPDYFRTMQVPLLQGRQFAESDDAKAPPVIIINQTLADMRWPHDSPIGKRIKQGFPQDKAPYREIVGVVGDLKQEGPDAQQLPEVFEPMAQSASQAMTVVLRTEADPMALAKPAENVIESVDKDLPVSAIQPMTRYISESLARRRFSTLLLGLFGGLALVLAAVGIYGVVAYTVAQRTHEIGIRTALGAQRLHILRLILERGGVLALAGVGLGLGSALGLTRLMASLLYEVRPTDLLTFAGVAMLLIFIALAACYIPARRATKVNPIVALRYE
jgi:predicted permease